MTSWRNEVVERLQGANPFAGFDPTGWTDSADEWDSHHPWFDQMVAELRPHTIVEVGSFLGVSSRHFAGLLKAAELDAVVVCVDTWLAEEVLWGSPEWRPHLRHVNGRPEVYKVWMANAITAGLANYLCPLPMDSASAARYLESRGISAELVYIDGSHMEGDVYRDLALYWDRVLITGGVMLVDDYQFTPEFTGVVHDVALFARERWLEIEVNGTKALFRKAG